MHLHEFEAMIARARYEFDKAYGDDEGQTRRVYISRIGPRLNIPVNGDEVDDLVAAAMEALLDEEGLLEG